MNSNQLKLQKLLQEYALSHQNPINKKIHQVCVPLIEFSILGLLMCLPRPAWMIHLNWSDLLIIFALVYYAQFQNWKVFWAMCLTVTIFLAVLNLMKPNLLIPCAVLFVLAWSAQLIGHKIEGKKPSFLKDIFFLLIGPIWIVKDFLGIA